MRQMDSLSFIFPFNKLQHRTSECYFARYLPNLMQNARLIADSKLYNSVNMPNGRFTFKSGNPQVLSDFK